MIRLEAETDENWIPSSWGVSSGVTEGDSLYVVGFYVVIIQVALRVAVLTCLHNPLQNQWCREFCPCLVNFEVGKKQRDRFVTDDSFQANFSNTWSQIFLILVIGWPL